MEWINSNDRLPEEDERVIIYSENKYGVTMGKVEFRKPEDTPASENKYLLYASWTDVFDNSAGRVTHWMPLPEPPKGE